MLEGFGRHIRQKRKADGKHMGDLAAMLGASVAYISDVELGRVPPPDDDGLRTWLVTIGVHGDELAMLVVAVALSAAVVIAADLMVQRFTRAAAVR